MVSLEKRLSNWLKNGERTTVYPGDVDLNDSTYLIPLFEDLEPLIASIAELGIINSPVIQRRAEGALIPVLGRRRLQASFAAGFTSVNARVISSQMPEDEGFVIALLDNLSVRRLDRAAVAYAIKRLLDLFSREQVAERFLPMLGIPRHGPMLDRLAGVGSLGQPFLKALAKGRIHEKTAVILSRLQAKDRAILLQLIQTLGINANKTADLIASIVDLSTIEEKPIAGYISNEPAQQILTDTDMPRPQRADRFRDLIRSRRHPDLVEKERDFQEWLKTLPRICDSARITIKPERSFETDEILVSIRADSREYVERLAEFLAVQDD